MDPVIDNDWLGYNKNEPVEEARNVGNIVRSWQWREHGIDPTHYPTNKTVLENMAEDILVRKPLKIRSCDLPGYPRSTFLMVFSPDGSKVASTHGNHNVYVSELASGKHVRILKGHPRTPWCIAFHPSHPQLIGSGCLGGQVRVWDIASGGSEVWNVRNETVIASIAFHPREQLLVIATHNELYFWDWSQSAPFMKVSTNNVNEKVRYVAFDALGYKLITGISVRANAGGHASSLLVQQNQAMGPTVMNTTNNGRDDDDNSNGNRPPDNPGSTQDMIVNSYQNLVQRYDSLVRNYQRLFRVRHRLVNTGTPPPPSTTDRGTDPMETDVSPSTSMFTRTARPTASTSQDNATASSSRRQDSGDSGGESSSSRLLNLDVLSINSDPSRNEEPAPPQGHSIFGSRSSAFQPLSERRTFRAGDQNERSTRLLPNPFSSSNNSPRPVRSSSDGLRQFCSPRPIRSSSDGLHQFFRDIDNSSRTSIFTSSRAESNREIFEREFLRRRWNYTPPTRISPRCTSASESTSSSSTRPSSQTGTSPRSTASMPGTSTQRPTMTNSSTQMSPLTGPVDAQSINESLDLIRDILRDSGTRLLNLITNMSLSTLASVERNMPRRASASRPHSDDSEGGNRPRPLIRPRVRLFSSSLRQDFLSSSSDSDSDRSLEVNIFRTRNSTFREDDPGEDERSAPSETAPPDSVQTATDRMVFELNNDSRNETSPQDFNVSVSRCRFRVRTQNNSAGEGTSSSSRSTAEPSGNRTQNTSDFNPNRPSTSRDNFWMRSPVVPPAEACRKVRGGVKALQKHTSQLTNMWLRGNRTTMRELRTMWENLRRRVVMLHRATGRQEVPTYYTRTLIERCMMLSELSGNLNTNRVPRNTQRNENSNRNTEEARDVPTDPANTSTNNATDNEPSNSNDNVSDNRQAQSRRSPLTRSSPNFRISPSARRRLQSSYRWRPEDELRRRSRNTPTNRLTARYSRCRRDFARAIEISATRHEIRMRAMQVLSVMFNMMMMCLEERGLSQLITEMLRMLKKALALTCLMLMTNRNSGRSSNTPTPPTQNVDSLNVVRIQNVDHTGPVNVDGPDDPASPHIQCEPEEAQKKLTETENKRAEDEQPSTSQSSVVDMQEDAVLPSTSTADQRWSNRLAVQIAAANRNTSSTARNRRDLYLESRRQKALHRTNPTAHPLIKKRVLPPVSTYRIPALRSLPNRVKVAGLKTPRARPIISDEEPVAGPSSAPTTENSNRESSVMNEFEHRVNLIRIAHMQAVSIRNAARNRFRRLQTIRLYTPSSVREMFALHTNNSDNQPGSRQPNQNANETGARRSFAAYTPMNGRSGSDSRPLEEFHTVLNNVAMPLMQVNDQPATTENQGPQPQRFPRIHEYLQPIILAQNAMVLDVEGSGGEAGAGGGGGGGSNGGGGSAARRMSGIAGLLDAGIISEVQPVPSHRVQAWDFTTGCTPDIADSTKNVVVQRCKIHNDASIDISKDGRLLVALLPVPRFRNTNHWLGVYSLEWARLGQCLHTAVLEQSAVSVALSPTARHLAVGLGSRRITTTPHARNNVFALLYKLEPRENSSRTGLSPIKELEQNWEHSFTSLNCIRWAPQPGQGLVYANNTGQLIIMS